jgi:hypothetical protein
MKTKLSGIALAFAFALLVGCASQSRVVYNSLASVQVATTGAYNAYLDLVIQAKVTTNAVPAISRDYNTFQQAWSAAVLIAQWNTNTIAPQYVLDLSSKLVTDISVAKGVK